MRPRSSLVFFSISFIFYYVSLTHSTHSTISPSLSDFLDRAASDENDENGVEKQKGASALAFASTRDVPALLHKVKWIRLQEEV